MPGRGGGGGGGGGGAAAVGGDVEEAMAPMLEESVPNSSLDAVPTVVAVLPWTRLGSGPAHKSRSVCTPESLTDI